MVKLSSGDLHQLADLAIAAAREAGQMIAVSRPRNIEHKPAAASHASQVVTEIDQRSQDIILDILDPTFEQFELALLTEEQHDDRGRLTADYFWCIDPLDGTLPFIEGTPGYAVSIALVGRDATPWIGVIYDPVDATMWHAISGVGAFRNGRAWAPEPQDPAAALSVFADRSFLRLDDHDVFVDGLTRIAADMGLSGCRFHTTAGAVMNAVGVLARPPACYLKPPRPTGGGSLWDFAATACVFNEVGAIATDVHGQAFDLNRRVSTFMNHRGILFATDEQLAQRVRALQRSIFG